MDGPSWSFGGSFVGHNMNGMNESTVNSHRWELIVNERGIGGNVIVSTLNPITVGRSTWRLKNGGQLDLRISRESLRLVDMGELEVTSLRKEKPCVRYRTWLAGPWIDLKVPHVIFVVRAQLSNPTSKPQQKKNSVEKLFALLEECLSSLCPNLLGSR